MKRSLILLSLAAILLTACGSGVSQTEQETRGIDGIEIAEVVFAKNLSEKMEPINAAIAFDPSEQVNVSVRITGRPKKGVLTVKFLYRDKIFFEKSVDFSKSKNGTSFSVGDSTFAGFYFTHEEILSISPNYRIALFINEKAAGEFSYGVVPPADAIKTVIRRTEFAKGVITFMQPNEPTTIFAPSDSVFFIGNGDFGRQSWLQAEWIANGNLLVQACTRKVFVKNNLEEDRFYFSCPIEEGWPTGTHAVRLTVDDVIVTEATFTVQ
jgi:hypothetical protein